MKTIAVELPEPIAAELDALVQKGWFADENEIIRIALWITPDALTPAYAAEAAAWQQAGYWARERLRRSVWRARSVPSNCSAG